MARDHRPPLDEQEAAEYIHMSVPYLRASRMRGTTKCKSAPPFIRIGSAIRYLPSDLDAWLESRRQFPGVVAVLTLAALGITSLMYLVQAVA
jgi:predicted DNA-binding transcriptional regulator AlpA